MKRILIAVIFVIFMLPTTIVIAGYEDDLKEREEKRLQEYNRNRPLQPSGTSPGPSYDPSYATENLNSSANIDSNDKPDNALQTNESKK